MGGYRSGRWGTAYTPKQTTDGVESVDVRECRRLGLIEPGQERLHSLRLAWTPCTYGGSRAWFVCPACQRRAGVLYAGKEGLECRLCSRLSYACQRWKPDARLLHRAGKTREQIIRRLTREERAALANPEHPLRPKGMHFRTYLRLIRQATQFEELGLLAMVRDVRQRFERLFEKRRA